MENNIILNDYEIGTLLHVLESESARAKIAVAQGRRNGEKTKRYTDELLNISRKLYAVLTENLNGK